MLAEHGYQRTKAANVILHPNWDMNWRKKELRVVGIIQDSELTITTTTGNMLPLLNFQLFNRQFLIKTCDKDFDEWHLVFYIFQLKDNTLKHN
jgi:hypothetical protein